VVVRSSELPLVKDHSIRVIIANSQTMAAKPDLYRRFMRAYRETVDWMYAGDEALRIYADFVGIPLDDARRIRDEFDPKDMLAPDRVTGLAIKFKFISKPLTDTQLKELVQIPQ